MARNREKKNETAMFWYMYAFSVSCISDVPLDYIIISEMKCIFAVVHENTLKNYLTKALNPSFAEYENSPHLADMLARPLVSS